MMDDIGLTAKMGIFINNVQKLKLKEVTVEGAEGQPFLLENIDEIIREDE